MTQPPDRSSALVMAVLLAAMCGSVMLFADFMQKRRELSGAGVEPRRSRS